MSVKFFDMSIFNHKEKSSSYNISIQSTIFIPFTVLFVAVFLAAAAYFTIIEAGKMKENSFLTIENNLKSISDGFDQTANDLNTTSQNIAYSNLVKEHFSSYLGYSSDDKSISNYSDIQNTRVLYDLLVAIIGPNMPVDQIYLYGLSGGSFGVGLDNKTSQQNAADFSWYENIKDTHGEKYIFLDKDERLSPYYSYKEGSYQLTLCRKYYNSLNVPQGIIEVKKSIMPLAKLIESYHINYDESYYVLNANGDLIYPINNTPNISETGAVFPDLYTQIMDAEQKNNKNRSYIDASSSQYIIYNISPKNEFISAAVVEKSNLLRPIYDYIISTVVVLLLVCICIVALSYFIAQRISTPLGKIYGQLSSFEINLDNLADKEFEDINTSIKEINGLYQAFLKMQSQTKASLNREIELKNQEMQSRMLALQAQMNPHFLYNSLATIQAMADEGMTDEIYLMCQNMSDILRYISSNNDQLVSLSDELKHTKAYLECMKIRYVDELSYTIDIPDTMLDIKIPKLCLQLIVENAIKFVVKKRSPWTIKITGYSSPNDWEIHIIDNGPGFSEDVLESLSEKIKDIDEKGVLPNLEISGMGLMNIYIRFKLLYKGQHVFRLSNSYPEGAKVTIGGTIV